MDLIFFADEVYDALSGILKIVFTNIYSDFSTSVHVSINAIFHFFIVFYAFMALKTGIVGSLLTIARTIFLLLITFNLSFNLSSFNDWIYDFVMDFPVHVAGYFVNSTISSLVPGFKPPESFNTSELFAKLCSILLSRAQASWDAAPGMNIFPPGASMYLFFVVIIICILYMAYWLIQFNFLVQASIYMIIGIPVILLASFRQTQSIFFEWLRAVITLMLYPVFASVVIFLVINVLAPLSGDSKNIINDSHVTLSTIGTLFCIVVFGIYALKQIPSMAAVMTRGSMTAGNPIQFAKGSAAQLLSVGRKLLNPESPLNRSKDSNNGSSTPKGSGLPGGNKGGGNNTPPGSKYVEGAKSDSDKNSIRQVAGSSGSPSSASSFRPSGPPPVSSSSSTGDSSDSLQSTPQFASLVPSSSVPSGSDLGQSDPSSSIPDIELKQQSESSGAVPTEGQAVERQAPGEAKSEVLSSGGPGPQISTNQYQTQNTENHGNREGEKSIHTDNSGDLRSSSYQQAQNISKAEDRSQNNLSSTISQSGSGPSTVNQHQSSIDQSSRTISQTRPAPAASALSSAGPRLPLSSGPSENGTQRDTVHTESKGPASGGSPSILPKVTPLKNPPTNQPSSKTGKNYEPKVDVKK